MQARLGRAFSLYLSSNRYFYTFPVPGKIGHRGKWRERMALVKPYKELTCFLVFEEEGYCHEWGEPCRGKKLLAVDEILREWQLM